VNKERSETNETGDTNERELRDNSGKQVMDRDTLEAYFDRMIIDGQ
jgi:hypothetical protein